MHIHCRGEDVTDEPILLLRAGEEQAALRVLLDYLARQANPGWDITHLRLMRRRESPGLASAWNMVRTGLPKTQSHLRAAAGQYVMDELSFMPLRLRPMLRISLRSLVRHWQFRFGFTCDCGFYRLPLPAQS